MSTKRLSVVIDADTKGFDRSIKGMQGTMSKATSGIGNALKKVGGAFSGLIGTIGKIAGTVGVFKLVDAGINMIKGSIDGAISRFDTLQNADRVFENMGFEAEETKKMMDSLNESITGLPTPLDSAVQGVQSLASSTGDLEGSEQIYSALNNAVLGFGGSNEDVDRTVTMLSRSLQKGKIQGDEFNTMMDTMGPVMNSVAKEMGYTTSELQEGLSKGTIDIDDFTDTLLRMNEEGGGGLVSLEQIAKDATGGIGTSIANMKTSFTRGMAGVIEAINEALEDRGLPNISEMIQIFGQKVSEVFGKVTEVIPPAIDWFMNLFNAIKESTAFNSLKEVVKDAMDGIQEFSESDAWESIKNVLGEIGQAILDIDFKEIISGIGEFLDKWGPLIAGIVGAVAVFKGITIAVGIFSGIMAVLTSPIALVALAIGLLIAVGVALWKNWDKIKAKASEIWDSIKDYFSETWQSIKNKASEIWDGIKTYFSETWESIKSTVSEKWKGIKTSLSEAWDSIVQSVSDFFTPIIEFFTTLWEDVKTSFETGWETITNVLTVAWMFIEEMFGLLLDIIMIPWNFIWENFAEPLTEVWEAIKTYLSETLETISNWISEKWEAIKTFTSEAWEAVKENIINPIKEAWDNLKEKVQEIWVGLKEKWEEIKTTASEKWEETKKAIVDPIKEAWNNLKEKVKEIWTGLKTKWEEIKTNATQKWNEIKSSIIDPIKQAWNDLKTKIEEIKTGVSTKWDEIKTTASEKWEEIKSAILDPIKQAWVDLGVKIDEIKTGISTKWDEIKTTATEKWDEIKSAISDPIKDAWNTVKEMVENIKGAMDFEWSLPKLKMPTFTKSGSFSLNPPSVPSFGISWKAMGGIATGPSIVGIGEAGDEAILPLSNKSKMKPFAHAVASMLPLDSFAVAGAGGGGDTIITGNHFVVREEADIKRIAQELKRLDDRESRSRGRRGIGN